MHEPDHIRVQLKVETDPMPKGIGKLKHATNYDVEFKRGKSCHHKEQTNDAVKIKMNSLPVYLWTCVWFWTASGMSFRVCLTGNFTNIASFMAFFETYKAVINGWQ